MSKDKAVTPIKNIVIDFSIDYPNKRALELHRWMNGNNNTKETVRHNTKNVSGRIRRFFIYDWNTTSLARAMNFLSKDCKKHVKLTILPQHLY